MAIVEKLRVLALTWVNSGRAKDWLEKATVEELDRLPDEAFGLESQIEVGLVTNGKRRRLPKNMHQPLTRDEADIVRIEMKGLVRRTREYIEKQKELGLRFGASRRQIGAAASGLARAAKRRRQGRKK